VEFPPYRHLPGLTPHPTRDPGGHSFGLEAAAARPFDPDRAWADPAFRRGVELFDAGYDWEAHEAFEGPWRATPRGAPGRDLLQGLIQVAAGLLKARGGQPAVAVRLVERGIGRLLRSGGGTGVCAGIEVGRLARELREHLAGGCRPRLLDRAGSAPGPCSGGPLPAR
jgi:hypothetical protein